MKRRLRFRLLRARRPEHQQQGDQVGGVDDAVTVHISACRVVRRTSKPSKRWARPGRPPPDNACESYNRSEAKRPARDATSQCP